MVRDFFARLPAPLQEHAQQLCYAMLCYAMLCYAMLCYAMLCYAMLCLKMDSMHEAAAFLQPTRAQNAW